jgi:hypothetical protein
MPLEKDRSIKYRGIKDRGIILILFLSMFSKMRNKFHVDGHTVISAKLTNLRKESIFQYDTERYPFLECAREILEIEVRVRVKARVRVRVRV